MESARGASCLTKEEGLRLGFPVRSESEKGKDPEYGLILLFEEKGFRRDI